MYVGSAGDESDALCTRGAAVYARYRDLPCEAPLRGRYVTIARAAQLSLCEVRGESDLGRSQSALVHLRQCFGCIGALLASVSTCHSSCTYVFVPSIGEVSALPRGIPS